METNRKNAHRRKRRNRSILYVGIGLFLIAYTWFWRAYVNVNETTKNIFNPITTNPMRDEEIVIDKATDPISFAFLGVDNGAYGRQEEVGRSDAILVGTINPNTETTTLISIPRDTYAYMSGYEEEYDYAEPYYDKLTHAYAYGEAEMAVNSIQELLNVPIDYYVEVNMQGLMDIVDAIGGIEVTSPLTFEYEGHYFEEGETYKLNGTEALAFARMRKDDPAGDTGRQVREKLVIKAILDKIMSFSTLTNYQSILETMEQNVKTNLTFDDLVKLRSGYGKSLENFQQGSLEVEEMWLGDIYYSYAHPVNRLEMSNRLRAELELEQVDMNSLTLTDIDSYYLELAGYYYDWVEEQWVAPEEPVVETEDSGV